MADNDLRGTAITRLLATGEQRDLLEQLIAEWKRGFQLATDMARGRYNAKSDVTSLAYDGMREKLTSEVKTRFSPCPGLLCPVCQPAEPRCSD
jgi:hypothetical protein